ncbi:MAG: virulence-associated E family protein [Firmicutes bacterium]|nr:virulence-associated E family protein [Bacillota bacterium]
MRTNRQGWEDQFYKWFVYMVAQWIFRDEIHANSTVPVLIGPQGYQKSTFCKLLLPPELRDYYKEHLDLGKKREAEESLTRFALINLDEFDSLSQANQSYLKHLLQKTEINLRTSF